MDFSYLISHFSRLSQAVCKGLIKYLSRKVSYDSMVINPFINGCSPNEVKTHLHICDHSIIPFGIKGFCLVFSNTSYDDSLYSFRTTVLYQVEFDLIIRFKNHSNEENMKRKYANESINNMILENPTTSVYQFILIKMIVMTRKIYNILIFVDWDYA